MSPSFLSFLFLIVAMVLISPTAAAAVDEQNQQRPIMPGGYHTIPDLRDARVRQVATFAAEQKYSNDLTFSSAVPVVVRGYQQVVAGMNYKLDIAMVVVAKDDSSSQTTTTVVGGFAVTVYDQFGQLSVTQWGKDFTQAQAEALFNGGQGDQRN